jgi:hypothetical protein
MKARRWGARARRAAADRSDAAAALLWAQAQQQLSQQNSELDALRTRAVAMLSVATLVAGLFGTRLPDGHHVQARTVAAVTVALALFAVSAVLAIRVAAPRKQWLFTFGLEPLLERVEAGSVKPGDVTLSLASRAEENRRANNVKLKPMYTMFGWICALVGLQVVAWAVAVL